MPVVLRHRRRHDTFFYHHNIWGRTTRHPRVFVAHIVHVTSDARVYAHFEN